MKSFLFARIILYFKLCSFCKSINARISFRTPFSLFSPITKARNDLYIETANYVYSIKLIGFWIRRKSLCFISPTCYSVREYGFCWLPSAYFDTHYERKSKKPYDFNAHLPRNNQKEVINCYIMCPEPWMQVSVLEGHVMKELCNGDDAGEAYIFTLNGIKRRIV